MPRNLAALADDDTVFEVTPLSTPVGFQASGAA